MIVFYNAKCTVRDFPGIMIAVLSFTSLYFQCNPQVRYSEIHNIRFTEASYNCSAATGINCMLVHNDLMKHSVNRSIYEKLNIEINGLMNFSLNDVTSELFGRVNK